MNSTWGQPRDGTPKNHVVEGALRDERVNHPPGLLLLFLGTPRTAERHRRTSLKFQHEVHPIQALGLVPLVG